MFNVEELDRVQSTYQEEVVTLYLIFSPLVGTFCVCPGLPQVEYAPLLFDNYNIAPEAVRIRNTGETESVVLSDILTSHRRSRAGVDGGSPG